MTFEKTKYFDLTNKVTGACIGCVAADDEEQAKSKGERKFYINAAFLKATERKEP